MADGLAAGGNRALEVDSGAGCVHSGRDFSRSKMYLKTQHSLHSSVVPIVTHAVPMKHTHSRQSPLPTRTLVSSAAQPLPAACTPDTVFTPPPARAFRSALLRLSGLSLPSPCARHCPFLSRYLSAAPLSIISLIQS